MKKTILLILSFGIFALAACNAEQSDNGAVQKPDSQQVTQAQTEARPPRPSEKEEQLKWLTSEFQHRHYLSIKDGKEYDRSDIVEKNDDMELWRIYMVLESEMVKKGLIGKKDVIEKTLPGPLKITEEKNGEIIAGTYAQTIYYEGGTNPNQNSIGVGYTMTFRDEGGKYIITNCTTVADLYYNTTLKTMQERYMKSGMSKSEANKKILESALAEIAEGRWWYGRE